MTYLEAFLPALCAWLSSSSSSSVPLRIGSRAAGAGETWIVRMRLLLLLLLDVVAEELLVLLIARLLA